MRGRNTGSPEHKKAAVYVAGEFERNGLKPAGSSGYLQPVPFAVQQIIEEQSSLALVRDGKLEPLKLGEDANLSARSEASSEMEAGAVFVGYGLTVPERNYNDLAGLDLRGKIAVYLAGGPADIPGPLKAHYQSAGERWKFLKAAGVIGVATIQNPKTSDIPWARATLARLQPTMRVADPTLDETPGERLSITINAEHADKFFAGSGHTIAEILADADNKRPLPRFPLAASIRARAVTKKWRVESQNVAGTLTGADPKLKNEYVVVSAHLDHVGVGQPINGDSIYNGAMDNASGSATLMETARAFHDQHVRPRRSIIFLAVTGEEEGELGSAYFALHPTVPVAQIIADLNTDMWLPIIPFKGVFAYGWDESDLGKDLEPVLKRRGLVNYADPEPEQVRFIRSDQYSFIKRGIPAMAFKTGYAPGSPEMTVAVDWRNARYHKVSDDLDQPIDFQCVTEFDAMYFELVRAVADRETRPAWNPGSVFGLIPRAK